MKEVTKDVDEINAKLAKLSKIAKIGFGEGSLSDCSLIGDIYAEKLLEWYPGEWKLIFQATKDGFLQRISIGSAMERDLRLLSLSLRRVIHSADTQLLDGARLKLT